MHKKPVLLVIVCLSVISLCGCSVFTGSQGEQSLNEGITLFNKGDYENAKLKFEEAVQKDPKLWEGYLYLAECSLKKGAFQESLNSAKQALALADKNAGNREKLKTFFSAGGQSALKKEDYKSAVLFFKESVALDPEDSAAHLLLGKALVARGEKGDMKASIGEFKAALAKSKNKEQDTQQIRASLFEKAKKYSQKGDTYTESRYYLAYTENFDPKDVEALVTVGRIFLKTGNPLGALYYAQRAYEINPKDKGAAQLLDYLNSPEHE